MAYTKHLESLPKSIQRVVRSGVGQLDPQIVFLFGSRARGDFNEFSDFDICFKGSLGPNRWSRFLADVDEKNHTLLKLDLLHFESLDEDYKESIRSEGKILYEK